MLFCLRFLSFPYLYSFFCCSTFASICHTWVFIRLPCIHSIRSLCSIPVPPALHVDGGGRPRGPSTCVLTQNRAHCTGWRNLGMPTCHTAPSVTADSGERGSFRFPLGTRNYFRQVWKYAKYANWNPHGVKYIRRCDYLEHINVRGRMKRRRFECP